MIKHRTADPLDILDVREMTADELPQVLAMWHEAGWGQLGADEWSARHRTGPHAASQVTVAVDPQGRVLGQLTMLRTALNVRGRSTTAARIHGVIMSPEYRRRNGHTALVQHPLLRMLRFALAGVRTDGVVTVFTVPNPRMLPLAAHLPAATRSHFRLWSRPLDGAPSLPAGHEIVPDPTPGDIDELWQRCRDGLVCTARDARTLAWKSLFSPLRIQGIARGSELVAIAASRQQGDRQWLVEDLLAVDLEAQAGALASVVAVARLQAAEQEIRKVSALAVPGLERALEQAGFAPDSFTFDLLVSTPGRDDEAADLHPSRWYLSPND